MYFAVPAGNRVNVAPTNLAPLKSRWIENVVMHYESIENNVHCNLYCLLVQTPVMMMHRKTQPAVTRSVLSTWLHGLPAFVVADVLFT